MCWCTQVIVDPATGRSKGYGFVRFANESERDKSLEMQGYTLCNRPVRVSLATARRSPSAGMPGTHPAELDPTNTTLFIGGLSAGVTEEQLRAIFVRYGDVVYTKIPQGKGCGFVQFVNRSDAEAAMAEMNGQVIGSSAIRISWGRSTSRAAALQQQLRPGVLGAFSPGAAGFATGFPAGLDAYGAAGGMVSGGMQAGQIGLFQAAAPAPSAGYDMNGNMYAGSALAGGMQGASAAEMMLRATQVCACMQALAQCPQLLRAASRQHCCCCCCVRTEVCRSSMCLCPSCAQPLSCFPQLRSHMSLCVVRYVLRSVPRYVHVNHRACLPTWRATLLACRWHQACPTSSS